MPSEYSKSIQKKQKSSTQRGRDRNKKITCPYLEPNQSMKLKRKKGLKSTNTLNQDHRLHIKEFFNLWSESSSFPNTNKFLSFHIVQNIHKGAACQVILRALPTNNPCHPKRVSFTEQESKTYQRGRKKNSKELESLHSEEGDQPSLL